MKTIQVLGVDTMTANENATLARFASLADKYQLIEGNIWEAHIGQKIEVRVLRGELQAFEDIDAAFDFIRSL